METRIKAKRTLLKESDLDSSLRLADAVRNSPTVRTPPVPAPPAPAQDELPAMVQARQKFEDVKAIVNAIYSKGRHRKWAKVIKQHALGEIITAGLDSDVFDLDDPTLVVHRSINELVYDTLGYIVEPDSVAYGYLLGTHDVSDRDGRRALADLVKGAADWTPTATTRKQQLWESLDPDFYAAIRVRYPRLVDLQHVSLAELSDLVASVYVAWSSSQAQQGGTAGTAASAAVPP
ncbi:hypothetical protein CYMTET_50917, partial [Cymbomonas tetramitiformis]